MKINTINKPSNRGAWLSLGAYTAIIISTIIFISIFGNLGWGFFATSLVGGAASLYAGIFIMLFSRVLEHRCKLEQLLPAPKLPAGIKILGGLSFAVILLIFGFLNGQGEIDAGTLTVWAFVSSACLGSIIGYAYGEICCKNCKEKTKI